ncbi:MAG: hypothetical protein R6X02_07400 [Enhygromyxa sp.]
MWTDDYDLLIDRELVVVRWRRPGVASARGLHPQLERHHFEIDTPLFLAVIVGPDCPPPDTATREALLRAHDRLFDCCQSVRMVVIGDKPRRAAMRSVITAMTLAAGLRGKAFEVDETIRDMAEIAGGSLERSAEEIVGRLLDAKLATCEELDR